MVAARRQDVSLLVSVAGNLDTLAWTRYHHLQPLQDSLNPIDVADALRGIPQIYFAGGKDPTIPAELVHAYAYKFAGKKLSLVYDEPTFDHHCCWVERWPVLWRKTLVQAKIKQ